MFYRTIGQNSTDGLSKGHDFPFWPVTCHMAHAKSLTGAGPAWNENDPTKPSKHATRVRWQSTALFWIRLPMLTRKTCKASLKLISTARSGDAAPTLQLGTDRPTDRRTRQAYRQTDRQADRQTDRQTDIHPERQTNRQTD